MNFYSQKEPLAELTSLASSKRQSIVITGPSGCGKSWLCKEYSNMLSVSDMITIAPKVADIRDAMDHCSEIRASVVICVENLDLGVPSASYTLLKSLEEPVPNLYIIITCRNLQAIPDTIVSRSAVVDVGPPTLEDIDSYGLANNKLRFSTVKNRLAWRCVRSFSDADEVLSMSNEEIEYYENLAELCTFKDSVSNMTWILGHYPSGKESNLEIVIRSIMELMHNPFISKIGIDCLRDLNQGRIAQHAVLAKFLFNAKYCE